MNSWKRITLVILVLIGGTVSFGFWSINQFNQVFDNLSDTLSTASVAHTQAVSSLLIKKNEVDVAPPSLEISTNAFATSTDPTVSFMFLHKDRGIYIGCTYPISWQASTTIRSLEIALVDAVPRDVVEQKISGLAKESVIKDSQHIDWKVGEALLSGTYYLKILKINDAEAVVRSKVFEINKMPEGLDEEEKNSLCR